MTSEEQTQLARSFIAAFNDGDWQSLEKTICPAVQYQEIPTKTSMRGAAPFLELCKGWKSIMSDCSGEVTHSLVSGDTVVLEVTWSGTQSGPIQTPLGEYPASGQFQKTDGVQILTMSDGKITGIKNHFDLLSMLMQFRAIG